MGSSTLTRGKTRHRRGLSPTRSPKPTSSLLAQVAHTAGTRKLKIQTPRWMIPLLGHARYKGAHGGRGSAKSHSFAAMLIAAHVKDPNRSTVCVREVQKSLAQSVKRLLEQKIRDMEVSDHFEIVQNEIRSRKGHGIIIFQGMTDHTAESIKSLEGFDCAWVEEAQSMSQRSLDLLRPTIRKPGSELWFTWNPHLPTDPVDMLLRGPNPPPDSIVIEANYTDNPWLPKELLREAEYDQKVNREKYQWVWGGKYRQHAQARYFKNWHVEDFEIPRSAQLRQGLDWGFNDPLVMVQCYIEGMKLYVVYEAYGIECTIRETPNLLLTVPDSEKIEICAGSDRPERIQDLRSAGFKVYKAVRGADSVERGLEWLENYEIILHRRCQHTIDEFELFSHPVDKLTGKVLPGYVDANNHCIEALRYACEAVRRLSRLKNHENGGSGGSNLVRPATSYWSEMNG